MWTRDLDIAFAIVGSEGDRIDAVSMGDGTIGLKVPLGSLFTSP